MKLAVFADIHSNYPVFKKAYEDALERNVDSFIFLGDYLTDGFEGDKVVDLIRDSKNNHVIRGNREDYIIEYHANHSIKGYNNIQNKIIENSYKYLSNDTIFYISELPIYEVFEVNGKKICISHGSPNDVKEKILSDSYEVFDKLINDFNCDVYLFGHQHVYFNMLYKNKMFINPGSIGLPNDGVLFKYGILTVDEDISYEKIEINYDFDVLVQYYRNSDYGKEVPLWCDLIIDELKTGIDYVSVYFRCVKEKIKEKNLLVKDNSELSDDIFYEAFEEYKKVISEEK